MMDPAVYDRVQRHAGKNGTDRSPADGKSQQIVHCIEIAHTEGGKVEYDLFIQQICAHQEEHPESIDVDGVSDFFVHGNNDTSKREKCVHKYIKKTE